MMIIARYRAFLTLAWRSLAPLLLLAAMAMPGVARANHLSAGLIVEAPGAPGATVMLALDMRPAPGWHGYWSNPGDAGFPMTLDWSLPPGAAAGIPRYPVPRPLVVGGLMNHVFDREYAVLVPLTLPRDATPGTVLPVRVAAAWLVCSLEICVPEKAMLATRVTIVAPGAAMPRDPRFAEWTRALPAPLGAAARFAVARDRLRLAVPLPASTRLDAPHFFADADGVIAYAAPQRFSREGDTLVIDLARASGTPGGPDRIAGVLRLDGAGDGLAIGAAPGQVPAGGTPLEDGSGASAPGAALGWLLLAALAGGLILNVMPCVFPILSLKALSLARAGESETRARAEGLAYTAGVVLACVGLGALLLALRAAGEEVGWAFQLQQPGVVAALLLLAVAITANLLGLFEFAVPGFAAGADPAESRLGGAFATGLLAAFVATPCTGPFMAAAMGAALLLPLPQALALFATLGLGLALPFLAIAFVPRLRALLPRPGAWMVWFRRLLALPMGLTALALLWLASRLGDWGFAAACALLALALTGMLAWAGRRQYAGLAVGRPLAGGLAILVVLAALVLPLAVRPPGIEAPGLLATRPFSADALNAARAGGGPVFAWFTADWCLTCKVNEAVAIERPAVRDAFAHAGVTVLKGDWTRRDPAITRYLTEHGAAGVPLYVWYPAGGAAPRVLPQVLGPETLVALAR